MTLKAVEMSSMYDLNIYHISIQMRVFECYSRDSCQQMSIIRLQGTRSTSINTIFASMHSLAFIVYSFFCIYCCLDMSRESLFGHKVAFPLMKII